MENKKYITIHNLLLANAIAFIIGEKPMVFDNSKYEGMKVYSFKNSDKIQEAMKIINDAKNKLR